MIVASTIVPAHRDPLGAQVLGHDVEQGMAETLLLEQMTELADRALVRHRLASQIDTDERAHPRRVVQRFFHRGVREIEPMLEEEHPQHALQADGRPAISGLRVHRVDAHAELALGHDPVHLGEELGPPRHLGAFLEASAGQRRLRTRHRHLPFSRGAARCITAQRARKRQTYSEIP